MAVKIKSEPMSRKVLTCLGCIAVPLVVGGLSALITSNAMVQFGQFNQPPLSPPAWLFPVAWTILYMLMGFASFMILKSRPVSAEGQTLRKVALVIYGVQLVFNFFWSIFFFYLKMHVFAFGWLIVMWAMIIALILVSRRISKTAMICLIPYAAWTTFAAYLNLMIAILN